jgi:hypothetical protein
MWSVYRSGGGGGFPYWLVVDEAGAEVCSCEAEDLARRIARLPEIEGAARAVVVLHDELRHDGLTGLDALARADNCVASLRALLAIDAGGRKGGKADRL